MRNKIGNMKLTVKRVHITCGMTAVKEATDTLSPHRMKSRKTAE